jgi:hypothetical protein
MIKGSKVKAVLFKQQTVDDDLWPFGCEESETTLHFGRWSAIIPSKSWGLWEFK